MKKTIVFLFILFAFPVNGFSLTPLPDTSLGNITGQAGVSIAAEVDIDLDIEVIAWGDGDGIGGSSTGGWVGLDNVKATLHYGIRSDAGTGFDMNAVELLTIDAATDPAMYNGASFVRIGLGTFELSGNFHADVNLWSYNSFNQELRTLDILGFQIMGGQNSYVDITSMGRDAGVTLGLHVILDQISIGSIAWGDSDGIDHLDNYASATLGNPLSSPGYIGAAHVSITDVGVTGLLSIDTATLDPAAILAMTPQTNAQSVLYKIGKFMQTNPDQISDTLVFLTLGNADGSADTGGGDIHVTIGTINKVNTIGDTRDLSLGSAGSVGIRGFTFVDNVSLVADGIVAIGAH